MGLTLVNEEVRFYMVPYKIEFLARKSCKTQKLHSFRLVDLGFTRL